MNQEKEIAILDFGSQYTHLIARRVRELGVVSHIYPNEVKATKLKNAVGIILSGGPKSVVRDAVLDYDPKIFKLGVPILGLCYGHQLMAQIFGGKVGSGQAREYGLAQTTIQPSAIFQGVKRATTVWMSHGDHVAQLPTGFKKIASTKNGSVTAMENIAEQIYGFQFHPEVHHTQGGKKMLHNFVFNICRAQKNWTTQIMLDNIKSETKAQAKNKKVFLLISGGVDSAVCFALLAKTLGPNRVYGLHVDHGLMRLNESKQVKTALEKIGLKNLHVVNAQKQFLTALKNVYDPEEKRKIIGNLFLDIADKVMTEKKMGSEWLIGQGTIYPDTIESGGTKNADLIKTHHNRVARIKQMIAKGKIIEPIKELYKDEVREVGQKLGLPKSLIFRHPFPGPGLGIRCLCSQGEAVKTEKLADESTKKALELYKLPIKSVGVQGDERSYSHPALIVTSKKQPTPWKQLAVLSPQITNRHREVNRVLLFLDGPKEKILSASLKKADVNAKRLALLQKLDAIVNKNILNNPKYAHIWQMPVVLVPFGYQHQETVVLRPVESEEAMTVSFAQIPPNILNKIVREIKAVNAVDFIFFDLTNKPPGTIEWE